MVIVVQLLALCHQELVVLRYARGKVEVVLSLKLRVRVIEAKPLNIGTLFDQLCEVRQIALTSDSQRREEALFDWARVATPAFVLDGGKLFYLNV